MDVSELLTGDDFKEVKKSVNKYGWLKTLKYQLQAKAFPIVVIVILVLLQVFSYFKNLESFDALNNRINQIQINIETGNTPLKQQQDNVSPKPVLGANSEFNENDWIIKNFSKDKDGFYCPSTKKFEYWSMWSNFKLPLTSNVIKIRLKVKKKDAGPVIPTVAISYGEYKPNYSPFVYYRLNIFDTDIKSIRLYNYQDQSVGQDWLPDDPDLIDNEMTISLSPRISDPSGRKLFINPEIKYVSLNSDNAYSNTYKSKSEFSTILPTVELEDGTIQQQLGIGTRYGACIKPISIDF